MFKKFVFFCVIIACVALSSCKTGQSAGSSAKSDKLSEKNKLDFTYLFFNANKEKILGNLEPAISLYQQCLLIDPNNGAALYEIANIYYSQGNSKNASPYARKAVEKEPNNIWYCSLLASILESEKKFSEVVHIYERLLKVYPERT